MRKKQEWGHLAIMKGNGVETLISFLEEKCLFTNNTFFKKKPQKN